MAFIKFKELTKYFDFKEEVIISDLPDYVVEYMSQGEKFLLAHKNSRDYALFTDKSMILFDKAVAIDMKKIHIIPYKSVSTSAIVFKPGGAEILLSLDSGYQVRLNFIKMNHDKKENLKIVYNIMMKR